MNLKRPRLLVVLPLLALAGAAAILAVSCSKGSVNPPPASAGATTAQTSIANCIVDSNNDVDIGGPDALPGCDTAVVEPSPDNPAVFGAVDVEPGGTLEIGASKTMAPASATTTYTFKQICINGGTVSPVPASAPNAKTSYTATSTNQIVIRFTGDRNTGPSQNQNECEKQGFQKGIDVLAGGTLILKGAKGVPSKGNGVSWTTLAKPAGPATAGVATGAGTSSGPSTLYLTADVTKGPVIPGTKVDEGWQKGDWIVVATSNFVPFDTEFVQIASVKKSTDKNCKDSKYGCSTVTLNKLTPLKYYHFGSLAPSSATASCPDPLYPADASAPATQAAFLCDGPGQNYGVDERAEVGLISRDITLTATTATIVKPAQLPSSTTNYGAATINEHWGGEIMIHQGFKKVVIQGVRISKFGKAKLGSYPIHFHLVGTIGQKPNPADQSALIDADSVDHSYNKCVTIHETSNLTVSNMVCARIVGHIFYEELGNAATTNAAADSDITFKNDLGLGAMSNSFDIYKTTVLSTGIVPTPLGTPPPNDPREAIPPGTYSRAEMIANYWWTGDYMTNNKSSDNYINYDGFNIPDTDNQQQQVDGSCYVPPPATQATGQWMGGVAAPCPPPKNPTLTYYIEPASGFWIQNPGTNLIGDAIGGCQGVGSGFWWVTPQNAIKVQGVSKVLQVHLFYERMGTIEDDRAHACYSGFNDDGTPGGINNVSPLSPHQKPMNASAPVIATLFGPTATRNRFRGLWLRTTWFVVKDGHFATNRDNVSLLTSGGIDGNAPGAWNLVEDSAIVGLSENNVGRWGPCPYTQLLPLVNGVRPIIGSLFGCIDYPYSTNAHSGEILDNGYQIPKWNSAGYYLYDGPALLHHDRFVDFNHNADWTLSMPCSGSGAGAYYRELDDADCAFVRAGDRTNMFNAYGRTPSPYEGDAALGWFNSNQNSYPTGTASKQLMFVNTNLRHQVFTEYVGLGGFFNDGDKNTSIIDEDGTLDGFGVKAAPNSGTYTKPYPISLNNLPFNGTSNSVDECLSRGAQDQEYEGRTSALMSPASMGTLQVSSLYPWLPDPKHPSFPGGSTTHWQTMTFYRTDLVLKYPPPAATNFNAMAMQTGRNGLGSYEPKVSNGYGYYVMVKPTPASVHSQDNTLEAGLGSWIDITLADVVDPNITKTHPFYIRLGVDYATVANGVPTKGTTFTIKRGYKSYYNSTTWLEDPELKPYWTELNCTNLDAVNPANLPTDAPGGQGKGYCPGGTVTTVTSAPSIASLTNPKTGAPVINKYYYNPTTGYLWLNIVQNEANPVGPSPTGSCASKYDGGKPDPACPHWDPTDPTQIPETYYACPKNGCTDYTITINDPGYKPGTSIGPPAVTSLKAAPAPATQNQLVYASNSATVTAVLHHDTTPDKVPFYTADPPAACTTTQPQP